MDEVASIYYSAIEQQQNIAFSFKEMTRQRGCAKVKYVCGYGLIIKKDRHKIVRILKNTNWKQYSNLAAHNCRHISMYHIEQALLEGGVHAHG